MPRITLGDYTLITESSRPTIYQDYCTHAKLVEVFESRDKNSSEWFIALGKGNDWPFLVVFQSYSPGPEGGFHPGLVLLPGTQRLFMGAGERLLAYTWETDLPHRLWEESILAGFWGWQHYRQFIIMSSELELAVWDALGNKQWDLFVEPSWDYRVEEDTIHVDVMGKQTSFSLQEGPKFRT